MKLKIILAWLVAAMAIIAVMSVFIWYQYTQLYVQDGEHTATTGIYWTKTLNLKEYKRVSNGNGVWGQYDRYSRSDRHDDVLTVYCNQYCSK